MAIVLDLQNFQAVAHHGIKGIVVSGVILIGHEAIFYVECNPAVVFDQVERIDEALGGNITVTQRRYGQKNIKILFLQKFKIIY